ncbi:Gypsy retrotransposon integrase-like protein 1 [Labeo rohita]|uniref:Gypsy retrotransposon integrase-like protein 1 n=1 Tax=Labeo rohita TaxID=84645 RepID=A0ABQ8LR77_LABRO|nr:Gypsy retrotransposon integrase-like protein 1 [Labeo rohita]
MSVQGDLAEQNESSLQEQVILITDKSENEIIEGVVRDRHASCTTCTEKSEARLKELNSVSLKTNEIRISSRDKRLTPKMQELKEQELALKERKFKSAYEKWKIHVRDVRSKLKHECSDSDLCDMMDGVEKQESDLKVLYDNMRLHAVPSQEIRRKIDACSAVTADLVKLMRVRLVEDGMEFDAEADRARLRMLLDCEYARSIYGSTVSRATVLSNHSKPSLESASISAKRAETAALLAAKKAEVEMEAYIDAQRQQLKKLENRRDIEVMEARLRVYTEEESRVKSQQCRSACSDVSDPSPLVSNTQRLNQQVTKGEASIVQVLQESEALSRLSVPEPFVFFGDPLKFIEWSTTFKALIERRYPNPADKLFYLQKYIDGETRSVLEGSLYRKDEQAYQQAWEKLNARYGHSNWVTSRWNFYVTKQLDQDKDYPSFIEFASLISKEACIACNPVSSLYALKNSEEKPLREIKCSRVNMLATTVEDLDAACTMADSSNIIDSKIKESSKLKNTLVHGTSSVECLICREGHSIHKCQKQMERTAEDMAPKIVEIGPFVLYARGAIQLHCMKNIGQEMTWIQRLVKKVKISEPLSVEERRRALFTLVRLAQQDALKEELHVLSQESGKLPCNHPLYQLDTFIQDGIMRVGGRLRKASVPFELWHPAILPKDSVVTRLILVHHHQKIQHHGRGQTLNELRVNGFWIIGGSKVVAQYIQQCVPCGRARRPLEQQQMADLPRDHTDPSPPFTYCGMDCFGPFYTKQGCKEYKRYGLLFTGLCSRAVHTELLEDMTADAFINALRCFIAIRGAVRQIRSDQGNNLLGAKSELKNTLKEMSKESVTAYLASQQCDFQFKSRWRNLGEADSNCEECNELSFGTKCRETK